MRRIFKMKQKTFFITSKGLSSKQIKQFFLEGESLNGRFRFIEHLSNFNKRKCVEFLKGNSSLVVLFVYILMKTYIN